VANGGRLSREIGGTCVAAFQVVLGNTLGKYRLVSKLGEGGMGTVYLAEHELLGSLAAIKVLLPQHVADPNVVQRFFNEARAASAIKHMGIVDIFDVGRLNDGTSYIVMELLRGETLGQRLRRGGMTLTQVVSVIAQTASALAAAHRAHVVHRDLKPENVFLIADRGAPAGLRVKLLDFGVAKLTGDHDPHLRTQIGLVLGTPDYMSPEQVRGDGNVDYRADLYALGCLMFRLLTGRPPYTGELSDVMRAHVLEPVPWLRAIDPRLPAELDEIVRALLAKDPMGRPRSADDVVDALGELGGGLLMPAMSSPLVPIAEPRRRTKHTTLSSATGTRTTVDPRRRRPRSRLAIAAAITAIAAAGVFGVWLGRANRDAGAAPARLTVVRPAPLAEPPPVPQTAIDAMLDAAPAPAHRHHATHVTPALAAKAPCVRTPPRRRPAAAAPRGRSPC
jgi:serine/threonine-protein kinase